jgi:hypothetical protein
MRPCGPPQLADDDPGVPRLKAEDLASLFVDGAKAWDDAVRDRTIPAKDDGNS